MRVPGKSFTMEDGEQVIHYKLVYYVIFQLEIIGRLFVIPLIHYIIPVIQVHYNHVTVM